jgi:hypothetical protein
VVASLGAALLLLCALRPGECAGPGLCVVSSAREPPGTCLLFGAGASPVEDRFLPFPHGTSFLVAGEMTTV